MMDVKVYTIQRRGDRALRFTGTLIGSGSHGSGGPSGYEGDWTRGVDVKIYAVGQDEAAVQASDRYVVVHRHWSQWQGESTWKDAALVRGAEALLNALRADGELRAAELEAWTEACATDVDLRAIECEEV